ncbi:MAG: EAL domain-containing protein, partial [Betaproteobacteria bacterium]|nr:EAL domain-containing protein [Betaproteobacteria bacterium]
RERNLLLAIVDSLPDHVYVKGPDRGYMLINAVGREMRGVASNKEVAGKTAFDFFPPQSAARFDAEDQAVMTTGIPLVNREHSTVDASGERRWHLTTKVPLRDPAGEIMGLIGINRDITGRKRAEEQLRLAASALEHAAEGVMISDEHRRIAFVNKAFTRITGYAPEEAIGRDPDFLRSGEHDAAFYEEVWSEIRNAGGWQGEMWRRRKGGDIYPEWRSVSSVKDEAGKTTHYVSVFTDISQLKQDKVRLEFLAHHDALTHLPNRTLFEDRLQEALNRAHRHAGKVGLLFVDLDRFKNVNDSLGHGAGDLLLQAVAERIKECVRKTDTVARLGGDEFAVLLDELAESQHAVNVAEKLRAALAQPFKLSGHELIISASIGISCYPHDGSDPQTLLKNADAAMYRAKEAGRDTYRFFAAEMHTVALDLLVMTNNLRLALERDELLLHYQPVVDLASGKVTALEALLRWKHPELGMIPPVRFIPVAEDSGLIVPIGEWVLKQACAQMKAWEAKGIAPRRIAVNLSARQFKQKDLPQHIAAILDETGLAPQRLELEITESMVMQDPAEAEKVLGQLHEMGIALAIDDFGTGYSSLSYLKRFPIDFLKIDRSFVRDIPGSPDDVAIARAIVALAKSLDLRVIAEGVETEQQLAFLKAEGCEEAQGYLLRKPISAEELEPLLRENARPLITAERQG